MYGSRQDLGMFHSRLLWLTSERGSERFDMYREFSDVCHCGLNVQVVFWRKSSWQNKRKAGAVVHGPSRVTVAAH
jgi:hypothetical protein